MNDNELGPTVEATVKESTRITPDSCDEVRQITLLIDDPSFRLGHNLLRNHHHVAVVQGQSGSHKSAEDQIGDIVARPHQRDPGQRRDRKLGGRARVELFGARHGRRPPAGQ